ncbi:hypothetical protein F1737_05955 [Methanoplanus sp. FWC-SCC4]|uniref:Uncharacterized protein n=1 Tax=Methanochimaera problematica TaxID=2609417 RepID=A0AA97I343_9EURY|nr:hypothetical protein [Methanoplanus sp. FWC-SCC4]WOF16288.1 hypothetical protein F1737_05955 [Methanoplanus sp. FWC-SCC4]
MVIKEWYDYWNLREDPFTLSPLDFKGSISYELFIDTDNIKKIETDISSIVNGELKKKLIILGGRGIGKSTSLNYYYHQIATRVSKSYSDISLKKYQYILPLLITFNNPTIFQNISTFTQGFILEFLDSLSTALIDSELNPNITGTGYIVNYIKKLKDNNEISPNNLKDIIDLVNQHFQKTIIFIDNLDKIKDDEIILNWLNYSQGLFENIFWQENVATIICGGAQVTWLYTSDSDDFSWFFDKPIVMDPWNSQDIKALITKRLSYMSKNSKSYSINDYFEDEALNLIITGCLGCPRKCQDVARRFLIYGAEKECKPISHKFYIDNKNYFEKFMTRDPEEYLCHFTNWFLLSTKMQKSHRTALKNVTTLLKKNKIKAKSLVDDLFILYNTDNFESVSNPTDLQIGNIVQYNKIDNTYILDIKVYNLLKDIHEHNFNDQNLTEQFLLNVGI